MVTRKEVVEKRKDMFDLSERNHTFIKGDKRIGAPRLCSVCGRTLSSLILREGKYIITHSHIRFHLNEYFIVNACKDINSCYRTLEKKGELKDGNV